MTSNADLAKAMKSALDESGDLIQVRVQIEEKMLEAFDHLEKTENASGNTLSLSNRGCKPAMPPEIILVNNLIRQYLVRVGLKKTDQVMCSESGLPDTPVSDHVLRSSLHADRYSCNQPLLCSMVKEISRSETGC